METATDPDVEAFLVQQNAASRRRLLVGIAIVAIIGGLVTAGYFVVRPTSCEQVVDRFCLYAPGAECTAFRKGVTQSVPVERCTEALRGLDIADSMPRHLRMPAVTKVLSEMMGTPSELEEALEEAAWAIHGPLGQLDRTGTLTAEAKSTLVSAPPAACFIILGKMRGDQPFAQQPLHEVLVSINDGHDLGPAPDDWQAWCQQRAGVTPQVGNDARD